MTRPANRIALVGQLRWCERLAAGLQERCSLRVNVAGLDSPRRIVSLAAWSRVFRAHTVVRVGFRPGATSMGGRIADLLFRIASALGPVRRQVIYWIGSDVQRAAQEAETGHGERIRACAPNATHIAGSQPLVDDLRGIGIDAELVPFPLEFGDLPVEPAPMPQRFAVLTYIPDGRPGFYGGPALLEAARSLPDVHFQVMGGSGTWAENAPGNVEFLGWVTDTASVYAAASCVVRMVEYDSIGGTVIEALLAGRPVIYSRHHPDTIHVPFGNATALTMAIAKLRDASEAGVLQADTQTARRTREEWDPARRFHALARAIQGSHPAKGANLS